MTNQKTGQQLIYYNKYTYNKCFCQFYLNELECKAGDLLP